MPEGVRRHALDVENPVHPVKAAFHIDLVVQHIFIDPLVMGATKEVGKPSRHGDRRPALGRLQLTFRQEHDHAAIEVHLIPCQMRNGTLALRRIERQQDESLDTVNSVAPFISKC